jgi:pSer/pThr/pTyr-binding forkhead associated (FHA) protein
MDLGSKNGTFMNDEPLSAMKAYPITEKRRIRMGHHTVIEIIPVQPLGVR